MMPTIRIDQDVFEGLQRIAKPFVDSPSSVIRQLLEEKGVLSKQAEKLQVPPPPVNGAARPAGALTPQPTYEKYLLWALHKAPQGKGHKRDITHEVIKRMMADGFIQAADQELVATGETKAENTTAWARNALKERGLISRISPRGTWELTPEGREAAKSVQLQKKV